MKLGYQTITWGGVVGHPAGVTSIKDLFYLANGSTEEAVREIAEAGYDGFELFDGNMAAFEHKKDYFRSLLRDSGLKVIAMYTGANFIYPDILEDELWKIDKSARLVSEFGAENLIVGGGGVRGGGIRDEDYDRLAESLNRVVEIAGRYGLTASYHPHLGTIVETPAQLDRLMPNTSINLCPDTGHIELGGGIAAEVVRKYKDRVHYIHLKDLKDGNFMPLGEGQVNFQDVLDALDLKNYNGWVTVELDYYAGPPKDPAIRSRQYLERKFGRPFKTGC